MKKLLAMTALMILALVVTGCRVMEVNSMVLTGSGRSVTQQYDITGFNAVDASSTFKVYVQQGDRHQVTVNADEKFMEFVRVEKVGSTLKLCLDTGGSIRGFNRGSLEATIVLPELESIRLSGASQGELENIRSNNLDVDLSGASALRGKATAQRMNMTVSGASTAKLEGSAGSGMLEASGASKIDMGNFTVEGAEFG